MGVEEVKNYLNEYFNYIRTVFLNEYSKYLSEDRIKEIQSLNDVFKIDLENKFRIYCTEKINVNLNIKDFILENKLNNDSELKDISIEGKVFIKYLVDNQNNLNEILLSQTINPIISYLIKYPGFLPKGLTDLITQNISEKYKLSYQFPYKSKELDILNKIMIIVGEKNIYRAILNNDYDEVRQLYNKNSEYDNLDFDSLNEELNKEYNYYFKKLGRVYYTDSLYDYQNLDYSTSLFSINKVLNNKIKQTDLQKNRFLSAYNSLNTLANHLIIYSSNEQLQIKNYIIEIKHIIEKLSTDMIHMDSYYKKLLMIEDSAIHLTEKLWKAELTYPLNYMEGNQFCFLVGSPKKMDSKYIEANLFTEKHLIYLNKVGIKYGIIYGIADNSIIYSSSKDILVTPTKEDKQSLNRVKIGNIDIEIDNQSDSRLIPPDLILKNNIKDNEMKGKVILNSEYAKMQAIYCIIEDNFDYNYERAKELSEMYNLPLIKIPKKLYIQNGKYQVNREIEVKDEFKEYKVVETLSDKVRKLKDKLLYEDDENLKKVI